MVGLQLIVGITQIVRAGTKLSIAIFDVAASVGNAEKDLQRIGTEVSLLCSVLKQVQGLLEHAHFHPSAIVVDSAQKIIDQCHTVFGEMATMMAPLSMESANEVFPAADIDFVSKAKWAFSRKSRISMLRSTLKSCRLTLSVMLNTMQLAERVSHRRQSSVSTFHEEEDDKAMTQSLLISQQYAVEKLGHWESVVEKEEELAQILPPSDQKLKVSGKKQRCRSRNRFVEMFSGLRIETQLPLTNSQNQQPIVHRERPSVWLENMLAPMPEPGVIHPGRLIQKRLSSVGTANAPLELLQRWTDQSEKLQLRYRPPTVKDAGKANTDIWRDSKFSFQEPSSTSTATEQQQEDTISHSSRKASEFVSPKTDRVHSVGFHVVAGVDGTMEASDSTTGTTAHKEDDTYEAITQAILQDHAAVLQVTQVALCIAYGGKTKVLKKDERPLEVLQHYSDLELEPRFFIRRVHGKPP